jgi:hypothetical protein
MKEKPCTQEKECRAFCLSSVPFKTIRIVFADILIEAILFMIMLSLI